MAAGLFSPKMAKMANPSPPGDGIEDQSEDAENDAMIKSNSLP